MVLRRQSVKGLPPHFNSSQEVISFFTCIIPFPTENRVLGIAFFFLFGHTPWRMGS